MSKTYKSYARLISQELGIEYSKVIDMSMAEVEEESKAQFKKIIEERMNNKDFVRRIELLLFDYDKFYAVLGDDLLRILCANGEEELFEYYHSKQDGVDYDSEEGTRLLVKKSNDDKTSYYSYYNHNRDKYLKLQSYYNITPMISDAICSRFPQLTHYNPSIYGYRETGVDAEISFIIKMNSQLPVNKDENEDDFDYDYDFEDCDEYISKKFCCTVESFLTMDWDIMLEDFLDSIGFYGVKRKEEELYKKTNDFLSSPEMKKFINLIKSTKKELYPDKEA